MGHNGQNFRHNRASGKESEHSIISKIKSIMCIGLVRSPLMQTYSVNYLHTHSSHVKEVLQYPSDITTAQ